MANDESSAGVSRKLSDFVQLVEVAVLISTMVTLYLAPGTIIRGEAEDLSTYLLGAIGIAFWTFAIATLAGEL